MGRVFSNAWTAYELQVSAAIVSVVLCCEHSANSQSR